MALLSEPARGQLTCERKSGKKKLGKRSDTTMNGTHTSNCPSASTAEKTWRNLCLLPDVHCFVNWQHRYWNNCVQDENHEKTHQLFHCKHGNVLYAVSDICDS